MKLKGLLSIALSAALAVSMSLSLPTSAIYADEISANYTGEIELTENAGENDAEISSDDPDAETRKYSNASSKSGSDSDSAEVSENTGSSVSSTDADAADETELTPQSGGIAINETNFPDSTFRNYITYSDSDGSNKSNFDTDGDGYLSDEEIANVTVIDINGNSSDYTTYSGGNRLTDLTGIEYFTDLEYFSLIYQPGEAGLESVDFSDNTKLAIVYLWDETALKSVKFGANSSLDTIEYDNYYEQGVLDDLDIDECPNLTMLHADNGNLSELDLTPFTKLTNLRCSSNALTELDVTNCPELADLCCGDNDISDLDISNCSKLYSFDCTCNNISVLDLSNCDKLKYLSCSGNNITALDLSTAGVSLNSIDCEDNKLTSLDVSSNTNLGILYGSGNYFSKIDLSGIDVNNSNLNGSLSNFKICKDGETNDATLDTTNKCINYSSPKELDIDDEEFPDDTFRKYILDNVDTDSDGKLNANEISAVSGEGSEGTFDLTDMDISNLKGIENFYGLCNLIVTGNDIASADLSALINLTNLIMPDNELIDLDISGCKNLLSIDVSDNELTSLDLSGCPDLASLSCYDNKLTSLDVSNNTKLAHIYAWDNEFTQIDVSKIADLDMLLYDFDGGDHGVTLDKTNKILYFGVDDDDDDNNNSTPGNAATEVQKKAIVAMNGGFAAPKDNIKIEQSGKMGKISIDPTASNNHITVAKGNKIKIDCSGASDFKVADANKSQLKINKKGVIRIKKTVDDGVITFSKDNTTVEVKVTAVDPKDTSYAASNATGVTSIKKQTVNASSGSTFDIPFKNIPLNASFSAAKGKGSISNLSTGSIGSDGYIHITGTTSGTGTVKIPYTVNGKKFTLKIKIK